MKLGLAILLLQIMAIPVLAKVADFYVSTEGSDNWTGKLEAPNDKKTDGPFASFEQARDAVRALKAKGLKRDILVQIRGGEYRLVEPIVFGVEDAGTSDAAIIYEAYNGETPVLHSDVKLSGWKRLKTPMPFLPEAAHGNVWMTDVGKGRNFYTLYDAEGRLPRARSEGFMPITPDSGREKSKNSKYALHFPAGRLRNWSNLDDIELVVRPNHAWIVNILPITSVDLETRITKVGVPATYSMNDLHFLQGTESVWIENAIDALDSPGEWVLDTEQRKLYLWPRADGPPKRITAPRLAEYIRVEGDIDLKGPRDTPVQHLTFRGLTFTRGETYRLNKNDKGLQHDWEMHDKANALLRFRGAENCVVENCHFLHSGGTAIRVDLLGRTNRIQNNHIEHIGATGVLLCGYGPGTKDLNHHNIIHNNHIHHVGEIYAHAPGIFLWQSGENHVSNNLIHHTPYSGMIISGVMTHFFSPRDNGRELTRTIHWDEVGRKQGYTLADVKRFLHTHDNLIEYNEIHHAMEQLGDGNGIYIRGAGSGNVIRRNYIHHLLSTTTLQSAIRTDGGQRDTLIAENIIYRCTSQGMHVKLNNHVVNNIIADVIESIHKGERRRPIYFKLREGPMTGGALQRNILYHPGDDAMFFDQGKNPRLPPAWAHQADTDHNLYYAAGDPELSQATLKKGRRAGIDQNSRAADPLFVDPANGNFRLMPGSPALNLGFVPIDQTKIGLQK